MSPVAPAFRSLDSKEAKRLRVLLHARDALLGIQVEMTRARSRSRLAEEFRRALKPLPRLRRMEADLLERRAEGLRREANALGAARFIRAQLIRATVRFFRRGR